MGGIEGHLNLLATHLVQRGHHVDVLVSNTNPWAQISVCDGVGVIKAPQIGRFFSAPLNYSFPLWIRKLGKACDLIHFHLPNPTASLAFQLAGLNKPYIVTYHADITRQKRLNLLYEASLNKFLKKANRIIATSKNYVLTSRVLRPFRRKCCVIPLGIDSARYTQTTELKREVGRIRAAQKVPIILFVGKFRDYKGLPFLIEAMKHVNGVLLLIGDGPLASEIKNQVIEAELGSRVFFLGELSDNQVTAYLHACDIFTLPSTQRSEAFGIVQIEAMACGKPVVSTELGTGTSYVNCNGVTGIVVPPEDSVALAGALNQLLAAPEKRLHYGQHGRKRQECLFSVEPMINATEAVYQEILRGEGSIELARVVAGCRQN